MKGLLEKYNEVLSICLHYLPAKGKTKKKNDEIMQVHTLLGEISLEEKGVELSDSEEEGLFQFVEWAGENFIIESRHWLPKDADPEDGGWMTSQELLYLWLETINVKSKVNTNGI